MESAGLPPVSAYTAGSRSNVELNGDDPRPQTSNTNILSSENTNPLPATDGSRANHDSDKVSSFHALPEELLDHILGYLVHEPTRLLPFDQRASLSSESFVSAPPHIPDDDKSAIQNFRNVCKKFWDIGRGRVFTRVEIRFSRKCFSRIKLLAGDSEIAKQVKKISYMVHDFYPQDIELWGELLHETQTTTVDCQRRYERMKLNESGTSTTFAIRRQQAEVERSRNNEILIEKAMARAEDQRQILQGDLDKNVLLAVLRAFKNLQQIRLMRNEDNLDKQWHDNFLKTHPAVRHNFQLPRWTLACERATTVLVRAYLDSESKAYRFSSRAMDPPPLWLLNSIQTSETSPAPGTSGPDLTAISNTQDNSSPARFCYVPTSKMSRLAKHLTCLELQIDDPNDLNEKMRQLSAVLGTFFNAAENMEGLHIGLRRPISIPLTTIFHDITWPHLLYIGFSLWNLTSDDIVNFLRRHRGSLRSVRLREVRLQEGRWVQVLRFIRQELKLKWASFRQVGYNPKIGGGPLTEPGHGGGFDRLRGPLEEDEFDLSSSESSDESVIGQHAGIGSTMQQAGDDEANSSETDDPEAIADSDSEAGETAADAEGEGIYETAQFAFEDEESRSPDITESGFDEDQETITSNITDSRFSDDGHNDEGEASPAGSIAGDSEAGAVNELAIDDQVMVQHSSASEDPPQNCDCRNGYGWHDLQDDDGGLDPTKREWKKWEKWVVRGCLTHDPPSF